MLLSLFHIHFQYCVYIINATKQAIVYQSSNIHVIYDLGRNLLNRFPKVIQLGVCQQHNLGKLRLKMLKENTKTMGKEGSCTKEHICLCCQISLMANENF